MTCYALNRTLLVGGVAYYRGLGRSKPLGGRLRSTGSCVCQVSRARHRRARLQGALPGLLLVLFAVKIRWHPWVSGVDMLPGKDVSTIPCFIVTSQRGRKHALDLVLVLVIAVRNAFTVLSCQRLEVLEVPSDHALLHLQCLDGLCEPRQHLVAATISGQQFPRGERMQRRSPGTGKHPYAEVVHPNFAVDVIHVVVIENVLGFQQAPRHDPLSTGEQRCYIGPARFRQREGAIQREGKRTSVAGGECGG